MVKEVVLFLRNHEDGQGQDRSPELNDLIIKRVFCVTKEGTEQEQIH